MQIDQTITSNANIIRSYGAGHIVVVSPLDEPVYDPEQAETRYHDVHRIEESILITPGGFFLNKLPQQVNEIEQHHFNEIAGFQPEVIIIGTGERIEFPDQKHTMNMWQKGIGVEIMDTAAACRTYNFLIADGRRVVAAIFMI